MMHGFRRFYLKAVYYESVSSAYVQVLSTGLHGFNLHRHTGNGSLSTCARSGRVRTSSFQSAADDTTWPQGITLVHIPGRPKPLFLSKLPNAFRKKCSG